MTLSPEMTASLLGNELSDDSWVRQAMFVPSMYMSAGRKRVREYSKAFGKFTDTTPGGNLAINPLPQFNPVCDPRIGSLSSGSHGQGQYYSDAIDDNQMRVSLQFGVPEFNSLASYASGFYNPHMASLVNRGETSSLAYKVSYAAGFLLTLPLQAFYGVVSITKKFISIATGNPYSKFYYMKPTMHLYWSSVQNIFTQLAVNMGIVGSGDLTETGEITNLTSDEIKTLKNILPDLFHVSSDGQDVNGIDVFAIANRAQRLANQHYDKLASLVRDASIRRPEDYVNAVKEYLDSGQGTLNDEGPSYAEYFNTMTEKNAIADQKARSIQVEESQGVPDPENDQSVLEDTGDYIKEKMQSIADNFRSNINDGAAFVSFAVSEIDPSESFNNNVKESPIAEKYNSAQRAAKDMRFSFADGNVAGSVQKSITDFFGAAATGFADSIGIGLADNIGKALADVPQIWDDSSAQLTSTTYRLQLRSIYGDKLSILLDLYLPLAILLAGVWPRSTGKHSYSSPFLCRLFMQGVADIKLGMITSVSVRRATSGIVLTSDGLPTGIDIDFEVTNMDNLIHMPMIPNTDFFRFFDEDSAFTDYLGSLSGLSLYDLYYFTPRFNLMWSKTVANFKSMTTPASVASWAAAGITGDLMNLIARDGTLR